MLARQRGPAAALMPFVFTSTLGAADDVARLSFPFGTYAGGVSQTPQVWLDNQVPVYGAQPVYGYKLP